MMQIFDRRKIERRVFERRRDRNPVTTQGIFLCDNCGYDAPSRKDDLFHHSRILTHAVTRIVFHLWEVLCETCKRLISLKLKKVAHVHHNGVLCSSCITSRQRPRLPILEDVGEVLHALCEALALVTMVLGGAVFAIVAFMFAIFPGSSRSDNYHDAIHREVKRRKEEDYKRRDDEIENDLRRQVEELHRERQREQDLEWQKEKRNPDNTNADLNDFRSRGRYDDDDFYRDSKPVISGKADTITSTIQVSR